MSHAVLRRSVAAIALAIVSLGDAFVASALAEDAGVIAEVDRTMENYRLDAHIPGMVWGIVQDGRLIHVKSAGVQDLDAKYKDVVQQLLFTPLGMTSTGFDVTAAPAERRAIGYRWEDNAWKLEPTMAHGAFGAMGGIP